MTAEVDEVVLDVEHLTKVYRKGVRANDDISLQVRPGHVLGLLGHNGAGKTTLLNQVIGLAKPTSGSIRIDDIDAVADPATARRLCAMQPQAQAPLEGITPRQAIALMARIRGATKRHAAERADELLAALDITDWANMPADKLSGGVKRLTAFAMTAAAPGRVVMFDEPTNDVDPVRRRMLWEQIRQLGAAGSAVVLVTHNVLEAEKAVEHLVILDKGKVVVQGTPAQLRGEYADTLRMELTALDPAGAEVLGREFDSEQEPVFAGRRVVLSVPTPKVGSALAWAERQRAEERIEEFAITPVSLEDVYIRLVGPESESGNGTPTDGSNRGGGERSEALAS